MPLRNRKASANTHDKRHENGLAPPTKKTPKPKLDIALSQNGNGTVLDPAAARSVFDVDEDSDDQSVADDHTHGTPAAVTMPVSRKTSTDGGSDGQSEGSTTTPPEEQESIIPIPQDAANGKAKRSSSVSSAGSTDPSTTIIWPHSLGDVVAILLFLLQLPPKALFIVQTGFAIMTYGNSIPAFSRNSLTSWHDWFHGYNGNPSIVNTIVFDLMFCCVWFSIGGVVPVLTEIILDIAQGIIAMYLGGGTSVKGGWSHTLVCILVITIPHLFRTSNWLAYATNPVQRLLSTTSLRSLDHVPLMFSHHHSDHGWYRTGMEIHIITHGIVRVIRRWFDRQPGTSSTRKVDPEASPSSANGVNGISIDSNGEGARNASTDGRPPGLPPAAKEKEKSISSGKKRRKQGIFVRSQQPFWAALASTKISVRKDPEHSQSSGDARDAVMAGAVGVRDRRSSLGEDRVWIERIEHNEVWFYAMIVSESSDAIDVTEMKHISVKVNGAPWSQFEARELDQDGDGAAVRGIFRGRIYDLSPSENFFLEFIEGAESRTFYSAHLVTRPIAKSETAAPLVPAQPQESFRPSSPVTTLKKSIATAEHQSNEVKARVRKIRKDRRTANSVLKKEVDSLEARLSTFSNGDDRQRQRQTQYLHNIKQADEGVVQIALQLENLAILPDSEREENDSTRRDWEQAKAASAAGREDFERTKAEAERELNVKKAAISSDRQKQERLEARLAKLEQTRDNLVASNLRVQRERLHRENLRNIMTNTYQAKERDFLNSIQYCETARQESETRLIEAQQQLFYLESTFSPPPSMNNSSQPAHLHTPESSFSGLINPHRAAAFANLHYPITTVTTMQHHRQNSSRPTTRARSSSMLSEISGFTEDEATSPTIPPVQRQSSMKEYSVMGPSIGRNSSAGSTAAGSAVGSNSQRDPKSPSLRFSPVAVGVEGGRGGSPRPWG